MARLGGAAMVMAAVLAPASLWACASAAPGDVAARFDAWVDAYRARDLARTMDIFDPDVRFQFQGAPDQTYADLERGYRLEFSQKTSGEWRMRREGLELSGDLATQFSTWTLVEGGNVKATNRSVDVLRRDQTCRWRIVRSFNYPAGKA